MLRGILFFCFLSVTFYSLAQNGSISGIVTDAKTGETVVGANVVIQGTSVGSATDMDGKFTIPNVKPGSYNLSVTFITYKTHTIPDVLVESGKVSRILVQMQEDVSELQEVVITGVREINTDISLISAIKESKLVVSGISAEQITKLPDNDAAQVMKRVPGITIVDNRFVMVRGIPERYNQVMINNAIAPSTEIDKRSFSFDLISSNAVDQLLIFKSGTAELPGDFGGGVIQLISKQASDEEYFNFGLNFGVRANTTFKDFAGSKKSSTDFLGFDNGLRGLPSDFPSSEALLSSDPYGETRANAGQSLSNNFGYTLKSAPIDYGFNAGFAKTFNFGRLRASNLTSLGYSKSYLSTQTGFIRYASFDRDPETKSDDLMNFSDAAFSDETKISLIHNWLFNIGSGKVEFKNLFVQLGEDKTTLRSGTDEGSLPGLYNNNAYHYVSRSIYSGQLQGAFKSANELNTYTVLLGLNHIGRNEPDYRRFRTNQSNPDDKFRMILPPSANLFDAGRFYSNLTDNGYSHGLNFERKLWKSEENSKRIPTIKAGYYTEYKTRAFNARYISYLYPGNFSGAYGDELSYLPVNEIFATENMFARNADGSFDEGFSIQEGTRSSDSYEGKNLLFSGYASASLPLGRFDISAGFRLEHNDQELTSYKGDSVINNTVTSPLPSLNIAYNLSERSLVRLAYFRSINRPEN